MALTRQTVLAVTERTGLVTSTPVAVPAGTTRVGLAISRPVLSGSHAEVVQGRVDLSRDGGGTWFEIGGCGTSAFPMLRKDTQPAVETTCLWSFRRVRALEGAPSLQIRVRLRYDIAWLGSVQVLFDDAPLPPRGPDHRSVTFDSDGDGVAISATSVTISSLTIANNPNRLLVAGAASWDATAGNARVGSVTWNGSGTGWAEHDFNQDGGNNTASLWRLLAPADATASVVITMGGTCAEIVANAAAFYDVDQTVPIGTAVKNSGTAATVTATVATAGDDDQVYDVWYANSTAQPTVGADQTQHQNANPPDVGLTWGLMSRQLGNVSGDVMTWTGLTGSIAWIGLAVPIKVAAAGDTSLMGAMSM